MVGFIAGFGSVPMSWTASSYASFVRTWWWLIHRTEYTLVRNVYEILQPDGETRLSLTNHVCFASDVEMLQGVRIWSGACCVACPPWKQCASPFRSAQRKLHPRNAPGPVTNRYQIFYLIDNYITEGGRIHQPDSFQRNSIFRVYDLV